MPRSFPLGNEFIERPRPVVPDTVLFEGANWDFSMLRQIYDACYEVGVGEFGLNPYSVQLEVISSEQMLDAYASIGLPLMYRHWSFGKHFAHHQTLYQKGIQGLAYEIVINSSPCLVYIMEENTSTMQALVIAHAGIGHNHFFKNNYLFRQWTDAEGILDYLKFAQDYVRRCEERHGVAAVERVLDAAHALQAYGVDRYKRHQKPNLKEEEKRQEERREHQRLAYNDLFEKTVPRAASTETPSEAAEQGRKLKEKLGLPEENLLYFFEKNAPKLEDWQRELIRIVRIVQQYLYPQKQLQLMNEGCATFVHHSILYRLWEKGLISEGNMLEFLHSHSSVVFQPGYDDPRFSGWNPYALGFAMMQDIYGTCTGHDWTHRGWTPRTPEQLAEDREWFPDIAGNGDPWGTLRFAWANYRDESFVSQYLSPRVIRRFRMFSVDDDSSKTSMQVEAIHNEPGYRKVRERLSRHYDLSRREPDIQIVGADVRGDRTLTLAHFAHDRVVLEEQSCRAVIEHAKTLWGYPVKLEERNAADGSVIKTY